MIFKAEGKNAEISYTERNSLPLQDYTDCIIIVEAVEKVLKQTPGRDAGKGDLIECATINDLMLAKGQVTPENTILTRQNDFSYRLVRPEGDSE